MAPNSPSAPGNPAGGPPAPPLDPYALNALLDRDPARAAAILAAMRPEQRARQARAHADLTGVPATRIAQKWVELIARVGPLSTAPVPLRGAATPCASVYDPETLGDLLVDQPALAHELLARLSEAQRVTQALAYAAWLERHGMPVRLDDVLGSWPGGEVGRAAA